MRDPFDFIVMGAGVMGMCTALAMQQRGYSVAILEAGTLEPSSDTQVQRAYALNLASQQLLDELEVWSHVQPHSTPYERMYVWDAQSDAKIAFDARMLARDRLGVILAESYLKEALLAQVRTRDVPIITQWQTKTIHPLEDKIQLCSADHTMEAAFLLITDGARSPTRAMLQIPVTAWSYHQHALIATVAVEKNHAHTAYQVFCAQGPLAFLPLQDPHHCAIVWSSAIPHIETLMGLSAEAFAQALEEAFEYKLGKVELLSPRKSYPLQMQHVQQYVGKRWALLGDAAHTIHPLAGLGLNMGLADLSTLLHLMDPKAAIPLSARALRAYQRQRKHALWQTILFLQGIHLLFTQSSLPVKMFRRYGLSVCDKLPMLKRKIMEHASGIEVQLA